VPNVRLDQYAKLVELAATKNGGTGQANEKPVEAADRERTTSAGQP